jgi:hypothetical protein
MNSKKAKRIAALLLVAMAASPPALAAPCPGFDEARNVAYMPYIRLVLGDLRAIDRSRGDAAFNAALNALSAKYAAGNTAEDVRRLIGIGLFNAMAAKAEPAKATFDLVCRSARNKLPPVNVFDPLACAVIALDRSRNEDPVNRRTANEMLELAKKDLDIDPDPASARQAFAAIAGSALACLSPP